MTAKAESEPPHDERRRRLAALVVKGNRFTYTYDFGDSSNTASWSKTCYAERGVAYPRCTAGKRSRPPEERRHLGLRRIPHRDRRPKPSRTRLLHGMVRRGFRPRTLRPPEINASLTLIRR